MILANAKVSHRISLVGKHVGRGAEDRGQTDWIVAFRFGFALVLLGMPLRFASLPSMSSRVQKWLCIYSLAAISRSKYPAVGL